MKRTKGRLKFIHILPDGSRFTDSIPADPDRHTAPSITSNATRDGKKRGRFGTGPGDPISDEFLAWRHEVNNVLRNYGYFFGNEPPPSKEVDHRPGIGAARAF